MRSASAVALVLSLALTGCGSDGGAEAPPEQSATEHNDADVAFATDMIQHHAQALAMVDLTLGRDLDPDVQAVADAVRTAQVPEIELMTDWLTSWGEDVPATVRDHANAGHGDEEHEDPGSTEDSDMPGMMSADEMDALEDSGDDEFQDLWLEMMIEHHEGAVEMAEVEQSEGRYEPAVDLAADIEQSQTAEIETMEGLLP